MRIRKQVHRPGFVSYASEADESQLFGESLVELECFEAIMGDIMVDGLAGDYGRGCRTKHDAPHIPFGSVFKFKTGWRSIHQLIGTPEIHFKVDERDLGVKEYLVITDEECVLKYANHSHQIPHFIIVANKEFHCIAPEGIGPNQMVYVNYGREYETLSDFVMTRLLWNDVRNVFTGARALGKEIVKWYNTSTLAREEASLSDVITVSEFVEILDRIKHSWKFNMRVFDIKRLCKASAFLRKPRINKPGMFVIKFYVEPGERDLRVKYGVSKQRLTQRDLDVSSRWYSYKKENCSVKCSESSLYKIIVLCLLDKAFR